MAAHLAPEDATCSHYEIVEREVRALANPQAVPPPSGSRRLDLWTLDWLLVPPAERGSWARKLLHLNYNDDKWILPECGAFRESQLEEVHDWAQAVLRRLDPGRCFVQEGPWPDEVVAGCADAHTQRTCACLD